MKMQDLFEMPSMVGADTYKRIVSADTQRKLEWATSAIDKMKIEKQVTPDIALMSARGQHELYLVRGDQVIGLMILSPNNKASEITGVQLFQVMNVFVDPELRNTKLGKAMYDFVLHDMNCGFASAAAMTPDSRRVYGSYSKDPSMQVYALDNNYTKRDMSIGPDGITTGDEQTDEQATFVITRK